MVCDSNTVETSLLEYAEAKRDSSFSSALVISDWCDLLPANDSSVQKPLEWPQNFANAGKPGVYFVFDAAESLLYVAMSQTDVQSRLGRYFGYVSSRSGPCKIKDISPPWKTRPRFVRTVATRDPREAPLLESFLIGVLQPPENTRGVSRPKPTQ